MVMNNQFSAPPYAKGWLKRENISTIDNYLGKRLTQNKRQHSSTNLELPEKNYHRDFITGSSYEGEWNKLDMEGCGKYTFPHGVIYEGGMKGGEFHGEGKLTYPQGQEISGQFHNGTMISWRFTFKNGHSCELKDYCKYPDRRFMNTLIGDFLPPERERVTNAEPAREIPKGHYDVGDGFYDSRTKWIYGPASFSQKDGPVLLRMPLKVVKPIDVTAYLPDGSPFIKKIPFVPIYQDEKFITERCRREWDQPTGYKPELYEKWMTGRQKENERYRRKFGILKKTEEQESNCLKLLDFFESIILKEKHNAEGQSQSQVKFDTL